MVDALDECPEAPELLRLMMDLYSMTAGQLRLFFSGRNNVQLPRRFQKFEVDLANNDTSTDLDLFISNETKTR